MLSPIYAQSPAWSDALPRVADLAQGAEAGAISVLLALGVLLLGWLVATLLSQIVRLLLRALRVDRGLSSGPGTGAGTGIDRPLHPPSGLAAWAVYWLVLGGTALLSMEILGFHLAASVAARLEDVVPRIVTSAVLFAVGTLIALLVGGIVRRFLDSARIRAAKLQGQIVSSTLTGFAALLALEQLGFAAHFVMAIGIAVVAAAGLGLALAFGLGCRDLARDFVVEYLRSLDDDAAKRPE